MDILHAFLYAILVIVLSGLAGWLLQIGFSWIFLNSTGQLPPTSAQIVNNLPIFFLGLGVLAAIIIVVVSVMNIHKK
jgi:hypothetical protein